MSKDDILDLYLNTIYFGANAYGVEAAALPTYFDKDPISSRSPRPPCWPAFPRPPAPTRRDSTRRPPATGATRCF